jgi:TetR/AcrR family transcriptional regulator, transcriptional repressor for nem operon
LQRSAQRFSAVADAEGFDKSLVAYLSLQHVDHPERGCALPSLTAEVARADPSVRAAFQEGLLRIHQALKQQVKSGDAAWALIAQCVGAVMLARAVVDDGIRSDLLAAAKKDGRAQRVRSSRKVTKP